jgi:Cu(I)/Ag(I) efflux system membrane fusion protein
VDAVLPAVDPGTNNGSVRIRLENRKHLLKLGMFASVRLPVTGGTNRLVVPKQAIYPDESGEPHVYKVVGDQAESVPVELGVQTKDKVEILSGVKEGDTVIFTGGYGIPEKSKIRVKQS